jgi:uncharacterized membrane protein YtjA (UPF0391 family)
MAKIIFFVALIHFLLSAGIGFARGHPDPLP